MFRKLLMCCPLSEGLHNRSSGFGTSSRPWITHTASTRLFCGSKEETHLTGEGGRVTALACLFRWFHCSNTRGALTPRFSTTIGVDLIDWHYSFVFDDFIIPYRLALVGDFPLTRRVTVPLTHEQ